MDEKFDLNDLDEFSLDLRISLLYCCFQQANYSRIIKELPLSFCYNENKRRPKLNLFKQIIKQFPTIINLKKEWINLKEEYRTVIKWFIQSTPMQYQTNGLSFLPRPDFNETLNCKHQFIINRKSNCKEFIESKHKYGSVIAYHGSPTHNWHAIIEHNLQNLSNTNQMTSGALFGSGIYLTSAISLSRSFSKMSKTWNKSKLGLSLSVVGVFEIALDPKYVKCDKVKDKNMKAPKHYYIVEDNRYIEIKGLLVWSETKKQEEHKTKLSFWLIAFYLFLLIALIMYQVKWDRFQKKTFRMIQNLLY